MKKSYINELISVSLPEKLLVYQIPTYENINSVTIITRGDVFVVFNSLNYGDSLTIDFNSKWTFEGKDLQKLNAPLNMNVIVTNPTTPTNQCSVWIKRFIN